MYDKNKINALFREYVFTEDDEFLAQLIEEISPMIDVCLSRWVTHKRHWPDAKQEMKLRLWRNLRNAKIDRTKQLINPSSYLFFLLRTLATRILTNLPDASVLSLDSILSQRSESANYF